MVLIGAMLSWIKHNKDAITVIMAIGSVLVSGIVWTFNYQYNQFLRINVLEKQIIELQRDFSSYHRTILLTELIKIEQEIAELQKKETITPAENNELLDLLVKQQIITKEISDIGQL